jgi:hypothetical protein
VDPAGPNPPGVDRMRFFKKSSCAEIVPNAFV